MNCPICKKPADPTYKPFCSRHCADVDLAHWFRGDYAFPAAESDEAVDDPDQSPSERDKLH
jgi:endogenous inhibitor of DNA gyrase (YacG/DUF329 family)